MDNNFYEYKREPRPRKEEKNKSIMTKIIAVQLVLSLLVSGILFAVCRNDSDLSQGIKSFYAGVCEKDMTASEILDVFRNVAQVTFSPTAEWEEDFSPNKENLNEQTTEETASGETDVTRTGEKADFSPAFLTVNFQNPIDSNNITSRFGYRISPITNEYSLHSGIDVAAPENTEICSVYNGIVEKAEYNEINGNYIVIRHSNTLKTTYNHCNKLLVREGEKVKQGKKIALVGATGWATGNHLHFEVILNGKYVNPLWVLNYEV